MMVQKIFSMLRMGAASHYAKQFKAGSALSMVLVLAGCASAPPTVYYSAQEAQAIIDRDAGKEIPKNVTLYPYYEESWTKQQPNDFANTRFVCTNSKRLTGKNALTFTKVSGNTFAGTLLETDECGGVERHSIQGRFNGTHLFAHFASKPESKTSVRRYRIEEGGLKILPEVQMSVGKTWIFQRNGQKIPDSGDKTYWTTEFIARTDGAERTQQLVDEARDGARAVRQRESAESSARQAAAFNYMNQAVRDTAQAYAAQRASTEALNRSIDQARDLAAARERERIANDREQLRLKQQQQAQQQAAQAQSAAQAQLAAGNRQAAQQAQEAQREAEARAQALARDAERQRRQAEQERQAQANTQQQMRLASATQAVPALPPGGAYNSNGQQRSAANNLPGLRASSNDETSKLIATPEAILVCTKPSGPKSSFQCETPVTRIRGHQEDISGHRTPEDVAMGADSCPSPRRLPSVTHLVWGCGFGATNNSNSMDRSAGVDVKGRNTYYCYEKETSCRRTTQ